MGRCENEGWGCVGLLDNQNLVTKDTKKHESETAVASRSPDPILGEGRIAKVAAREGRTVVGATIEWVCQEQSQRVDALFEALDLKSEALTGVNEAWRQGDKVKACRVLLDHYAGSDLAERWGSERVVAGEDTTTAAEAILRDEYTFLNVTGSPDRKPDGSLEWTYRGPNDDAEWAYFLNRHGHIEILISAYRETGNAKYIERVDSDIREWVIVNPYGWEQTRDPRWRGLETMSRINVWSNLFYGLIDDPKLQDGTRILLLSSIPEHAHYTQHFHNNTGNWLAMQMRSLSLSGLAFPEFRDQEAWIAYSYHALLPQIERQVYPDGAQKELASHYHGSTLMAFQSFTDLYEQAGEQLPQAWYDGLEGMWNYWAYSLRPDGHGVLNNDSNLDYNRPKLSRMHTRFSRPDWAYIASNGNMGERPESLPSQMFPWAGQLISRSGWDADAHWSVFDVGPWGIGHQHQDKLHLSVSTYGQDFLVDAGRLYYKKDAWRDWIQGTRAHNTLIIDDCEQKPDVKEVDEPLEEGSYTVQEQFDFARSAFTAGYEGLEGNAVHNRSVMYMRGIGWIVIDRVTSDADREIEALWHFHPDVEVVLEDMVSVAEHPSGSVSLYPIGGWNGTAKTIRGQEPPYIQGWYSREYNHKAPATCVSYTGKRSGQSFGWAIVPWKNSLAQIELTLSDQEDIVRVSGTIDGNGIEASIPVTGGSPELSLE